MTEQLWPRHMRDAVYRRLMPLFAFEGRAPRVDPTAFVAPTATLIGDVTVEAGRVGLVQRRAAGRLRADRGARRRQRAGRVGVARAAGHPGGHRPGRHGGAPVCSSTGSTSGAEALIANHATVLDGAVIGARSLVAAAIRWCWPAPRFRPGCWSVGLAGEGEGPGGRNGRRNVGQPQPAGVPRSCAATFGRTGRSGRLGWRTDPVAAARALR